MKRSNLVIESGDSSEVFDILLNIEAEEANYLIYTKHEENDCGDTIAYAATYNFKGGKQKIRPVEDEDVLEFLDVILLQIQNKMNGGE